MATTYFCSQTDLENILSVAGVQLRADDVPPTLLGEVINMATEDVRWACWEHYDDAPLAASDQVRFWTASLAAYYLCERRGNPVPIGVAQKVDRAVKKLDEVKTARSRIPGVSQRRARAPMVSNIRATQRPFPRSVVEKTRSTGSPQGYQMNQDPYDRIGVNDQTFMDYSI